MADTDVSNDDLEGKVLSWLATQPADKLEEVYTLLKLAFQLMLMVRETLYFT